MRNGKFPTDIPNALGAVFCMFGFIYLMIEILKEI